VKEIWIFKVETINIEKRSK